METKIVRDVADLRHLVWTQTRKSSGTAGSFLKAYSDLDGKKIYYKLSRFDSVRGIVGHECANELVVDRLLTLLGAEHLHYQLIHAEILMDGKPCTTYLCASEDFKRRGEGKIALDAYYQAECRDGKSLLDFCAERGWGAYLYEMLVVDFLILNRDRHGANIEVLRDGKRKTLRLAPLFDHGLSLILSEDGLENLNVMEDRRVQCCVGSSSATENLRLIPKGRFPRWNPLRETEREFLFSDMEGILSPALQEKMWEMIWRRWQFYEDFRHSG